jgi:hypothetical protein
MLDANDRRALLLGFFQSLMLGVLMRFYGMVAGLSAVVPFITGLAFVGFALGARRPMEPGQTGRQWRFLAALAALAFLLLSRLYYVNFFKAFFTGRWPVLPLVLLGAGVCLACMVFGYVGACYAASLRVSQRPLLNYALLALGFTGGALFFGLVGGAFVGVYTPEYSVLFAVLAAYFMVDIPQRGKVLGVSMAVLLFAMLFVSQWQFGRIAFTWGVNDYKRVADEWSPYYKIDMLSFKGDSVLWGLYNYTGMLLASRRFEDMEAAAPMNEALYLAAMPPGARTALILGSGGGMSHPGLFTPHMSRVTAVEIDPVIVNIMSTRFSAYNRGFYNDPRVTPVIAEGRAFLQSNPAMYDYIEYESLDTRLYSAGMNIVPVENRLYTREGLAAAMSRLAPEGLMRITMGTDDDARVVLPVVSGLPDDVFFDVYRVTIDMELLTGVGEQGAGGALAGWKKDMPHTAILVAKKKYMLDRVRRWQAELPGAERAKIQRLDLARDPGAALTDNKPFVGGASQPGLSVWLFVLAAAIAPALAAYGRRPHGARRGTLAFFYLVGAAYVCLEILFLALGVRGSLNPAWTALWLTSLFVLGNAAACAAASVLHPGRGVLGAAALLLAAGVAASLQLTQTPGAAMAASLAAGFLGGLFWPAALERVPAAARAHALSWDALGAFPGVVIFHASLYLMGFHAAALCTVGLYIAAWVVFSAKFHNA